MRARKCDCCGKFYEEYSGAKKFKEKGKANALILIDRDIDNHHWNRAEYDLCPDCMGELVVFLSGKKEE